MQRMKQLARTAVYWPGIDNDIVALCRSCVTCAEHQNAPPKSPVHPLVLPEKPWSRLHIDHAVNFLGQNWLVVTDAYTKYPQGRIQAGPAGPFGPGLSLKRGPPFGVIYTTYFFVVTVNIFRKNFHETDFGYDISNTLNISSGIALE